MNGYTEFVATMTERGWTDRQIEAAWQAAYADELEQARRDRAADFDLYGELPETPCLDADQFMSFHA